jgi:two-component system, LuxR family, response regulator FixJ
MCVRPLLVLIADRDAAIRDALRFSLELEGLMVRDYNDVAALLSDPDLSAANCVVLDDRMPGIDGLELLRQFENDSIAVPVILLTNHATEHNRDRALAAGATLVLEKPFLNNGLTENVLRVVRARA